MCLLLCLSSVATAGLMFGTFFRMSLVCSVVHAMHLFCLVNAFDTFDYNAFDCDKDLFSACNAVFLHLNAFFLCLVSGTLDWVMKDLFRLSFPYFIW